MSIEKPLRELVQAELKSRLAPMNKAIARMDERLGVIAEIVDIIHRLAPMATRMQTLQMALPGMSLPIQGRGRAAATPPPAAPAPPTPAPAPAPRQAAPPAAPAAPSTPTRPPLSYPASRYALPTHTPPAPARAEPAPAAVPAPRGRPAAAKSPAAAPSRAASKASPGTRSEAGRKCAVIGCKRPSRSKGYCSAHYQKLRLLVKSGRRPDAWVDDASSQSVQDVVLPRGRAAAKEREETPPPAPVRPEPPKPKAWVRKKGEKDRGAPLN